MSRFVRQSKYRHVFAGPPKRDDCLDGIKFTKQSWDSNWIEANPTFMAVAWQVGGGGAAAVLPVGLTGKQSETPLITGHSGPVLDMSWSPFNDHLLATASDDAYAKIWQIPEGGLTENMTESAQDLRGHRRKVGSVDFHPSAENIVATSSTDYTVKVWDISSGKETHSIEGHSDIIQSVDWSHDGALLVTYCKDKKIRVIDPRTQEITASADGHGGVKGGRAIFLGDSGMVFSVGFTRTAERSYAVLDPRNMDTPVLAPVSLDHSSGVLIPFYDSDTKCLFLAGRGDGNIRYFEFVPEEKKVLFPLSQYQSNEPTSAVGMMPKRGVDVNVNEIVRIYKGTDTRIQPISFRVPRKSDLFQDDIFPDCASDEPALTAEEWIGGKTAPPKTKSMEGGFEAKAAAPVATFTKVEEEKPKTEAELRTENEALTKRVAYLEAELTKKDAEIASLKKA